MKKEKILIYHHLGLGDHFSCNGLVRYLYKKNNKKQSFYLVCKRRYKKMVDFMFRDLKLLKIIPVSNFSQNESRDVLKIIKKNNISKFNKIGFDFFVKNKNLINNEMTIDMLFYKQVGLPYKNRFKLSYWKRDLLSENKLFKKNVKKKYAFVHDDSSRGFKIEDKNINKNLQIIRNDPKMNIFDYGKIIENASEIHVMESSTRCMLESLNTSRSKHYLYIWKNGPWKSIPFVKKNKFIGTMKKWHYIYLNYKKKNLSYFLKKVKLNLAI